jgi:ATP-binding dynein motor region
LLSQEVLVNWSAQLDELALAHSKPFSLIACLGDPVKIREWHMGGLSEDNFAVESALTTLNCDAWPLLYDPQAQGVQWVTSMEKKLLVTNTSHPDFALKVEKAVTEGISILVHLHQPNIPKLLGRNLIFVSTFTVRLHKKQFFCQNLKKLPNVF